MRIFVSFADGPEGDREVASRLIESLRRQGIDVFEYTRPSGEYVGTELQQKLHDQISLAHVFVFLATEKSTNPLRQVIVEEVRIAISLSRSEGVLLYPVLLAQQAPRREWVSISELAIRRTFSRASTAMAPLAQFWRSSLLHYEGALFFRERDWAELLEKCSPFVRANLGRTRPLQYFGPFDQLLRSLEYEVLHSTSTERIDTCVANICQKVGFSYQPRIAHHPRLPLRTKMMEELREFQEAHTLQEHSIQSLLDFASNFEADRTLANWSECLGCIEGAIQVLRGVSRTMGKTIACPYLHVVKGICLLQIGKPDAAQNICKLLLEKGCACEGNVTGLLGRILFERGEFANAIAQSSISIDEAERTDGKPAHLARVDRLRMVFSILEQSQDDRWESNRELFVKCREIVRDEWVFEDIDSVELMSDRERIECNRIRAHRHYFLGEFSNAKEILECLIDSPVAEFENALLLDDATKKEVPVPVLAYLDREEILMGDSARLRVTHLDSDLLLTIDDSLITVKSLSGNRISVHYLDEDIALLNARVLLAMVEIDQARDYLVYSANALSSRVLLHVLAALEDVHLNSPHRALQIINDLLKRNGERHPNDLVLAAWLGQRVKSNESSLELAKEAITCLLEGAKTSQSDYYYLGFAYYLVGNADLSSHYFTKSGENVWYDYFSW